MELPVITPCIEEIVNDPNDSVDMIITPMDENREEETLEEQVPQGNQDYNHGGRDEEKKEESIEAQTPINMNDGP